MSNETQTDKLNCSFCGKVQDEVKKLIAGPSVYICNECVDLCNDIIEEEIKNHTTFNLGDEMLYVIHKNNDITNELRSEEIAKYASQQSSKKEVRDNHY